MQDTPFHYMAVGFLLYILGQGVENVIVGEYWEGVKFLGASLIGLGHLNLRSKHLVWAVGTHYSRHLHY